MAAAKPSPEVAVAVAPSPASNTAQQALECLALLVALNLWAPRWLSRRCCLHIRGDNLTMLTLVEKLKVSNRSPGVTLVGREVSLLFARANYRPVLPEHIPGIANVISDGLSRIWMPDTKYDIPEVLAGVPRDNPPGRSRSYYRTLV